MVKGLPSVAEKHAICETCTCHWKTKKRGDTQEEQMACNIEAVVDTHILIWAHHSCLNQRKVVHTHVY